MVVDGEKMKGRCRKGQLMFRRDRRGRKCLTPVFFEDYEVFVDECLGFDAIVVRSLPPVLLCDL